MGTDRKGSVPEQTAGWMVDETCSLAQLHRAGLSRAGVHVHAGGCRVGGRSSRPPLGRRTNKAHSSLVEVQQAGGRVQVVLVYMACPLHAMRPAM